MIKRYDLCGWVWPSMSMLSSIVLSPVKDGRYVLYTDHIAETRKLIDTYDLLISQEDKKIAELEAERDGYRNGQQQVQDLLAKQIDNSLKLAAENKRLAALFRRHSEKCRGWFGNPEDPEWETEVKRINENFGL